jgi:hypothetical protein
MIPTFWFRWLQVVTIGVILYGAGLMVMPGLTLDFNVVFNMLFLALYAVAFIATRHHFNGRRLEEVYEKS